MAPRSSLTSFGLDTPFDEQALLVTSPFFSPVVLACIRLFIAVYTLFILIFNLVRDVRVYHDGDSYLSYFTCLSYIGVCSYFFASGVQTLAHALRVRHGKHGYPLQYWPRTLQFLHLYLCASILTLPIIVTIVFWGLLGMDSSSSSTAIFLTVSQHALNTFFIVLEIVLTNVPPPFWGYFAPCIVILGLYLGVAYITHATQGFYTYPFLDPSKQHALLAAYIVGIAVAELIVFLIVHLLMRLRVRLTGIGSGTTTTARRVSRASWFGRKGGRNGESEEGVVQEGLDEWEEVERPKTPVKHEA